MPDARPIGVFDSGVGGLTVARALIDLLPDERIVYLGDTARGPYGPLPLPLVRDRAATIVEWLGAADAKLIVAACNTATAALEPGVPPASATAASFTTTAPASATAPGAESRPSAPVVGVIRPAVVAAARATRTGRVGVIGTTATVASGSYPRAFAEIAPSVGLTARACPRFVDLVERGRTTGPDVLARVADDLAPLIAADVDTVVLGCTHYPLLTGALAYVLGPQVTLVSSAEETARHVVARLIDGDLLAPGGASGAHRFVASGDPDVFRALALRFLGPRLADVAVEHPGEPAPALARRA